MSAIERIRARLAGRSAPRRFHLFMMVATCLGIGAAGMALAQDAHEPSAKVARLLSLRLPKTQLTKVDCDKLSSLCEVTAGANLFYVDGSARYLVVGRVYDMETRQDLTAARLLEINPDMLVGGAARANASLDPQASDETGVAGIPGAGARVARTTPQPRPGTLKLEGLPADGAIVWGNPGGATVTVFSDFRCTYCRALSNVLRDMNVRVVERPISVLGSRDLADRVYCAKNKVAALHAAYAGEPLAPAPKCDTTGLDANEAFAQSHALSGTPVIVRSDGAMLEGFRPREFLAAWLKEPQS